MHKIHQYNYSYYCGNDSDESEKNCANETYDALVLELKSLENQYPELRLEDSPTVFLRGVPNTAFPKIYFWDVKVCKIQMRKGR